jgi:hypothetical protein
MNTGLKLVDTRRYAHDEGHTSLRTHCNKSAKHLPLPGAYDAYESLHMLTMLSTP